MNEKFFFVDKFEQPIHLLITKQFNSKDTITKIFDHIHLCRIKVNRLNSIGIDKRI